MGHSLRCQSCLTRRLFCGKFQDFEFPSFYCGGGVVVQGNLRGLLACAFFVTRHRRTVGSYHICLVLRDGLNTLANNCLYIESGKSSWNLEPNKQLEIIHINFKGTFSIPSKEQDNTFATTPLEAAYHRIRSEPYVPTQHTTHQTAHNVPTEEQKARRDLFVHQWGRNRKHKPLTRPWRQLSPFPPTMDPPRLQ